MSIIVSGAERKTHEEEEEAATKLVAYEKRLNKSMSETALKNSLSEQLLRRNSGHLHKN